MLIAASSRTRATARARRPTRRRRSPRSSARRPSLVHPRHLAPGQRARRAPDPRPSSSANIPQVPVIMISGHGTIETAVGAIKKGAYDFIEKPFKADRLLLVVERALEAARLRRENEELRSRAGGEAELIGTSPAIAAAAPGDRAGGADRQPRADHRPGRRRQGGGGAADPRPLAPRRRAVRGPQLRRHAARAAGGRAVRLRGRLEGPGSRARSAPSSAPMAARCCSTRWPTCRWRPRARSCACCRSRASSASAASTGSRSTCG